ncbi:MAG TPA: permease-like cell division protein FtsX, partial [Acidimicrobiales bacterium]
MPVSVGYISKEAGTNLWRNRLMTIAAVLTVAVSLALVGSALLLKQGASNATTRWQQGVDVAVFVKAGAPTSQYNAIGTELKQLPFVKSCTARSQSWDFAEAKQLEPPDLSNALSVSDVPSSWRCHLTVASQASIITEQFTGKPGVATVASPTAQIHTMENVIHILQWVFLSIAVVLLLSASVLILNTIRMAIFARRREVSVMKLVGATNWFIRVPYMLEGVIQGLGGAIVAGGIVAVVSFFLRY